MDPIPVLSQLKSLVQVMSGRREQARQTQINFSRQCPVISQARSAVEAIKGDQAAARETQKEFGRFVVGVVNGVPGVGHISGGIHYALGDKDGGDLAMKAASHTTAVMAGGIGGLFIGGPVVAVGLGIGAGVAMDSAITGIDTAVHWKKERKVRMYGITEPFSDPKDPGKWFDAAFGLALDGVTAFGAGKLAHGVRMRSGARGSPVKVVNNFETAGVIRPSVPTDWSSIKETKEEQSNTSPIMEKEDERIGRSSVKKTEEECSDERSIKETEDGSVDERSIEETEEECNDESSIKETEDGSGDESSLKETEEEIMRPKGTNEAKRCGKQGKSGSDDWEISNYSLGNKTLLIKLTLAMVVIHFIAILIVLIT